MKLPRPIRQLLCRHVFGLPGPIVSRNSYKECVKCGTIRVALTLETGPK